MNPHEITITDKTGDTIQALNYPDRVYVIVSEDNARSVVSLSHDQARELASALTGDDTDDGPVDEAVIEAVADALEDARYSSIGDDCAGTVIREVCVKDARVIAAAGLLVKRLPAQKTPPVGQVRRNGTAVATRIDTVWVRVDSTCLPHIRYLTDDHVAEWEIIYTPEEEA